MTVKLKTPSNGSISLTPQDTASDVVVTVPAATGTVNTSGVVNEVPAGSASAPAIYPTGDTNTGIFFPAADTIAFSVGGAGAMRIDSSGNLLVGTTTLYPGGSNTAVGFMYENAGTFFVSRASGAAATFNRNSDGANVLFNRSGTSVGNVSVTTTATTYNTSSDYRLKENIQPMQNALAVVQQLNPVTYTWKTDGSDGQGFIAHELQAVVPDCVTGEKDAVDAEGKPIYQGVDTSFLVATLTAAIQEQQAIINSLQDRITALENA